MTTYHNKVKLQVENLKKSFGNTIVLNGVSLHVNENEFVTILGPSGSGKSTMFNIISGLIKPDSGRIFLDGQDFTGRTGKVSYMHQKDLLFPWRKVIDNASLPLIIKGMTKKDAREAVKGYMKIFGLEGFEYKYPFQLSGGMRQRTALLRTYMFAKDIMLLDEPFGALDAITRSKMQYWLMEVLETLQAAVLLVTHDIEEAIFLSDRIYILSDRPGEIKEEIIIDLERPRRKEVVTAARFNEIRKHILEIF